MKDYRQTKEGKRRFANPTIYGLTHWIQNVLWRLGISWHNSYSDECTKNFSCCNKK